MRPLFTQKIYQTLIIVADLLMTKFCFHNDPNTHTAIWVFINQQNAIVYLNYLKKKISSTNYLIYHL